MVDPNDHRSAALPKVKYARPPSIDEEGFRVTVYGEDGSLFGTFDFTDIDAPKEFVKSLVLGFDKATGSEGRWRTKSSVGTAANTLRSFASRIAKENCDLSTINELTPEIWWAWRKSIEARARWPGQINLIRALLYDVEGVPDSTIRAIKARTKKPKSREYKAYSRDEFRRIQTAAWRVVRKARRRILGNLAYLEKFRRGLEPDNSPSLPILKKKWTKGMLLDYISRTGMFPRSSLPSHSNKRESTNVPNYLSDKFRVLLDVANEGHISQAIFATSFEIYSLLILFVCERGYNLSVLDNMKASELRADALDGEEKIQIVSLDKPRRGPEKRYFTNSLSGKSATLWKIAKEITEPARNALQELGTPTDKLFVGRILGGVSENGSPFRCDWSDAATSIISWHSHVEIKDDAGNPLRVTFKRIRLSEQVINQKSSQNSEEVSESIYRAQDPSTHQNAIDVILQGQVDAINDANSVIAIKMLSPQKIVEAKENVAPLAAEYGISIARLKQLIAGNLDTATAACVDFYDSPYSAKGELCTASFLVCLGCKNAIATPDHIPRLVALHDALMEISSAVSQAIWKSDYRDSFIRLKALLSQNATEREMANARGLISNEDILRVKMLLSKDLDA